MGDSASQADLRALVLGLLTRREMYGCEIATLLAAEGIELSEGSVYPILRRLEREGLLSARWVEIGEGAPRRRYYILTPAGERQAAGALDRAHKPASAIVRFQGVRS
jgi:PadR family transcriptional regulator PadR